MQLGLTEFTQGILGAFISPRAMVTIDLMEQAMRDARLAARCRGLRREGPYRCFHNAQGEASPLMRNQFHAVVPGAQMI